MKIDSRPLDDLGDPHAEPGSKPWAVWVANEIRKALYDNKQSGTRLQSLTQSFKQHEGYKPLGYRTWPDFCKRKLQTTPDEVEEETQLRLGQHGGDRRSSGFQPYNCKVETWGNSAEYKAARLARDFPDALAEVKPGGKYRSMNAAAKAVGIVKDKPRIAIDGEDMEKAAALLAKRLTPAQIGALISALIPYIDLDDEAPLDAASFS